MSEATFRRHTSCEVVPGDILMTMMGTIGRVYRVPEGAPRGIINPRLVRMSFDHSRILPEFAESVLDQPPLQRLLDRRSHGGTMQGLNLEALASIRLQVPPIPEQRRIAEILGSWDEAIEKLEALRAAKEQRRDALTYSMVFGARRLSDFDGQEIPRKCRWFDLPQSWDCKPVGEVAEEVAERNGGGEHEVLSCSKHQGFVRSLEYFNKQVFSSNLSGYKVIRRGDFGFPSNHVEEGSIGLQNLVDSGLVSPIYTVFRFNHAFIDNDFAFAVLKTSLYRHIFEVTTSGSVDRRGSLRWSEFSKIPFPLPPLQEQRAIVAAIQASRADVEATTREITALQRQKRGLAQKLLTGEWRINEVPEGVHG